MRAVRVASTIDSSLRENIMKTMHVIRRKSGSQIGHLTHQRGMGATMILFTIALIVLVGAALAYASRGNPTAVNKQTAKVQSAVVLKQGADYRDAYNRYIFDGLSQTTLTFDATTTGLFLPATQYGNLQAAPQQAMSTLTTPTAWLFSKLIVVTGIGTTAADTIAYLPDLSAAVCSEINNQLFGTGVAAPPVSTTASATTLGTGTATLANPETNTGTRAAGCFQGSDSKYIAFNVLGEF